jgi:hypothetical protein
VKSLDASPITVPQEPSMSRKLAPLFLVGLLGACGGKTDDADAAAEANKIGLNEAMAPNPDLKDKTAVQDQLVKKVRSLAQ